MIAKNVTRADLEHCAHELGIRIDNYRHEGSRVVRHLFVLRLGPTRAYQRVSNRGRKVAAVCWHGHRDFFRALFTRQPAAVVSSHWSGGDITYTADTFETRYPETGHANIGSEGEPMEYRRACLCKGEE